MLRELLHSSLSEASLKLYLRAWVVFTEFYHCYQSIHVNLPVSTACVALFISFLCAKGLAPATINSYLLAIAYVHKIKRYYDPTKSFLIEKLLVAVGQCSQADIRLPISRPPLHKLVWALPHTSTSAYQRALYGSMFMIAFYEFVTQISDLSDRILQYLGIRDFRNFGSRPRTSKPLNEKFKITTTKQNKTTKKHNKGGLTFYSYPKWMLGFPVIKLEINFP